MSHKSIRNILGVIVVLQIFFAVGRQPVCAADALSPNLKLAETISNTLESERTGLKNLKQRLARLKDIRNSLAAELNVYKIQNTALGNLALQPQVRLEDLESALSETQMAITNLDTRVKEIKADQENIDSLRRQNAKQLQTSRDELKALEKEPQVSSQSSVYIPSLKKLIDNYQEKQRVLNDFDTIQKEEIVKATEIYNKLKELETNLTSDIRERKKQELFQRSDSMLNIVQGENFSEEIQILQKRFKEKFSRAYWDSQITAFKGVGEVPLAFSLFLLLLTLLLLNRFRHYCLRIEKAIDMGLNPYRYLAVHLLRRSLMVLGLAGFLYLSDLIFLGRYNFPIVSLLLKAMVIWILCRWALAFLKFWETRMPGWLPGWLPKRLLRLVRWGRWVALGYIAIVGLLGSTIAFLFVFRLGIVVSLSFWCVYFWKAMDAFYEKESQPLPAPELKKLFIARLLSFTIVFTGLFAALFGYGFLALYWYSSWAKSLAVGMWATILYHLIREWRITTKASKPTALQTPSDGPYYWLLYQLLRLMWLLLISVAFLFAWGDSQGVFKIADAFLNHSFAIGKIRLTLLSIIYAFLILFGTHMLTQIGRHILRDKILSEGNFERGLEDSIITITTYLLWGLGLVISLSVLGVNTTSLAMVFGALSIGIGFGLQTIFNNFISGLILLLERPIQVGDAVEIGGIWGEVRKINVRATVVQTYDNASLIIPNSEFISQQVTNWTFKDQRIRRQVKIGVAYGSDVDLVKATLLEIIAKTPNVRQYPAPDVLFWDHGDSALIFNLRYWTDVDGFLSTESNVRFEITRLFKEREIEIAFPQLDVHLHNQ